MVERHHLHIRELALTLITLAVFPTFVGAQSPPSAPAENIRVGDPGVDGSFLKPYKNAWKVVYAFPGKRHLDR